MANTFKSVTSGSIGTVLTNVYSCPASTTTIILGAAMANTDNNPIGGSIKLAKSGSSEGADNVFIVKAAPVPAGSTVEVMSGNKVVLQEEDILQFQSDTAGSLDAVVSMLEIT
jgi:hypothetical protein|tara:strand:- start:332 stop:670 length:339 start_codon:yes stop_codon:yes gene_type:complete